MNIFVLDKDPMISASYHNDKHVVKMIVESAQMLSTAHRVSGEVSLELNERIYKEAYKNHPCSVWVRESSRNYQWLYTLFLGLLVEYEKRFGKKHSCLKLVSPLSNVPKFVPHAKITPFAQAMPDNYKNDCAVKAYRAYYNGDKKHLFSWRLPSQKPEWAL